jgi:hypothetical protein
MKRRMPPKTPGGSATARQSYRYAPIATLNALTFWQFGQYDAGLRQMAGRRRTYRAVDPSPLTGSGAPAHSA